jgi:hypothetical protein
MAEHLLTPAGSPFWFFALWLALFELFDDYVMTGSALQTSSVVVHYAYSMQLLREYLRPNGEHGCSLQTAGVKHVRRRARSCVLHQGVCTVRQLRACSPAFGNTSHRRIYNIVAHQGGRLAWRQVCAFCQLGWG